jgi:hypothetical protein
MIDKLALELIRFSQLRNCQPGTDDPECNTNLPQVDADVGTFRDILSIVFAVIAGVALLIIVIQGLKFVLSKGEPEKAAEARKAIIYAAVGLGIALLAEAVVVLVMGKLVS